MKPPQTDSFAVPAFIEPYWLFIILLPLISLCLFYGWFLFRPTRKQLSWAVVVAFWLGLGFGYVKLLGKF